MSKNLNTEEKVFATGFKGFDPDMKCRDKQYAENTVFEEKGGRQYSKLIVLAENVQFLSSRREQQENPPRPPADHPQGRSASRRPVDNAYAPEMPDADSGYAADDNPF